MGISISIGGSGSAEYGNSPSGPKPNQGWMRLFSRPCGTLLFVGLPGIEMPGYCRVSLRDKGGEVKVELEDSRLEMCKIPWNQT